MIQDVGAAKGFLICTSGFARSNHQYARTLGIELLTVEDVRSDKWKAEVEIPLIYVRKHTKYRLVAEIIANAELVEMNRGRPLTIYFDATSMISFDSGKTSLPIQAHIENLLRDPNTKVRDGQALDLFRPNLQLSIAGVWTEVSVLSADLTVGRTVYLKYVTPDEYSHIRDHVRGLTLPLHLASSGSFPILDNTFVEVPGEHAPVFPGLYTEAEEWTDLERAQDSRI